MRQGDMDKLFLVPREPTRWRRLLQRVAGFLPARQIVLHGHLLFMRYHVCRLPGGGHVYLHHYLAPDDDQGMHDHPWDWARSLILAGGYWETRPKCECIVFGRGARVFTQNVLRLPGDTYKLRGEDFHRITDFTEGSSSSWSLFMHGPYTKGWGYAIENDDGVMYEESSHVGASATRGEWYHSAPRGRTFHAAS
jgi:hypothetical protein